MPGGKVMLPRSAILGALFLIMMSPAIGFYVEGTITKTAMIASFIAFFLIVNEFIREKIT